MGEGAGLWDADVSSDSSSSTLLGDFRGTGGASMSS